jgi:predicted amidohydrolase
MQRNFVRIAGAQIPVTHNLQENISEIKTALDWASNNGVDYLATPEASLSGYKENFNTPELIEALGIIEKYAASKNIGLFLGTLWEEVLFDGSQELNNQIRVYDKRGKLIQWFVKKILCPLDIQIGIKFNTEVKVAWLETDNPNLFIPMAGVICNDLYGKEGYAPVMQELYQHKYKLYVHATNAERNIDATYDSVFREYNNAVVRLVSYLSKDRAILTVDNSAGMDGEPSSNTSSTSGVLHEGTWLTTVPDGTQYFYHDLSLEEYGVKPDED